MSSDDLEMLSAEDGARARRLGCVCAAMAIERTPGVDPRSPHTRAPIHSLTYP